MRHACSILLVLAACGGGGGGAVRTPPTTAELSWTIEPTVIGVGDASGVLTFRLGDVPSPPPALLELQFELPPQLELAAPEQSLEPATELALLDGDVVDGRFVVLCGDASAIDAPPLPTGPLFRLRLRPVAPRQAGAYPVRVRLIQVAAADGGEVGTTEPSPGGVTVTVE